MYWMWPVWPCGWMREFVAVLVGAIKNIIQQLHCTCAVLSLVILSSIKLCAVATVL